MYITIFPVTTTNIKGQTERWPLQKCVIIVVIAQKIFILGPLNVKRSTILVTGMISCYLRMFYVVYHTRIV